MSLTAAIAPALVLLGTPGQTAPAAQTASPELSGPLADPAVQTPVQTAPAAPQPSQSGTPELSDPLADPAAASSAPEATQSDQPVTVVEGRTPGDPLEGFNRKMFNQQQKFDKAIFRPVAMGYKHVVPKPVRSGLRNAISNVGEPIVFLNYLLQFKPGKAIETAARFLVNSVFGVGGLIDVAKAPGIRLPHRPNGFGDTLGYYGVKPGPYLFLPFVGPTNLRDFIGGQGDGFVLPLAVGNPFDRWQYQVPKGMISGLDQRAESDDDLRALYDGAVDPYATLRSVYLQNRQGEIDALHGRRGTVVEVPELGEPLADPGAGHTAPAGGDSVAPELSDPLADPAAAAPALAPDKAASPELSDPLTDPAASPRTDPITGAKAAPSPAKSN